jgi:hypothetical protein
MTPREIIAEAWAVTTRETKLRKWGFISAFFELLRDIEFILYQVYFLYFYWKGITVGYLSVEILFFESMPFWLFLAITIFLLILLVVEFFIPSLCTGAIIGLAAKSYRKEEVKGGLVLGLYNFFPILVFREFFLLSHFTTVFVIWSFILRYGGDDPALKVTAMFILFVVWIFTSLLHFFASFAEQAIVIRKASVFSAMGRSFKLILSYLGHVLFLFVLLLIISLRIFVNALLAFLIPGLVIGLGVLLTFILPKIISYGISSIIGIILLLFLSHFLAYLHVFKQTVWTIAYEELSAKKDLDVIAE